MNLHPFDGVKCQGLWAQGTEMPVIKIKPVRHIYVDDKAPVVRVEILIKNFKWTKLKIMKKEESKTLTDIGIKNTFL